MFLKILLAFQVDPENTIKSKTMLFRTCLNKEGIKNKQTILLAFNPKFLEIGVGGA